MNRTEKIYEYFQTPMKQKNGKVFQVSSTSLRLSEALVLNRLVSESGAERTLEIGLALGASAVAIAEALEQKGVEGGHTVLDPFQEYFENIGLDEVERLGLMPRIKFVPEFSEHYLFEAVKGGSHFDFIFNDGAHSIGDKMTTTFFADRCLAEGGVMAFHDAFIHPTVECVRYLVQDRAYEPIPLLPDSPLKRLGRILKYGLIHGWWFAHCIVPYTHHSIIALRKTPLSVV